MLSLMSKLKKWFNPYCKNLSRDDACISVWCAISFIGLGTTLTIFGPTLLDLADYVGVGIAELAAILFCRSVGSVIGAVGSGFLCDHYKKTSLWLLSIDIICSAILTCVIPVSPHIAVLGVLMFAHGFCLGALDNGVHAILMNIWKHNDTGPIMQLIHFTFSFGAFLSPLFAKPFISDDPTDSIPPSSNISCTNVSSLIVNSTACLSDLIDMCNNDTIGSGNMDEYFFMNENCTNSSISNNHLFYGFSYWVAVIPLLIPLPSLIYYAVKKQCCCQMNKDRRQSIQPEETQVTDQDNKYPSSKIYIGVVLTLLFIFMAVYVGLEVSFGTYVFAFAVKGSLKLSKQRAATLSSLFWGMFSFTRCFSIFISLLKVPPSVMLSGNLTGSFVASLILLIWNNNEIAVWIGSGLLGASCSAIYPTAMVWMSQHVPPTGRSTSVLGTGAVVGDTLFPLLVGVLLDKLAPISLVYYVFIAVTVCVLIAVVLFIGTKLYLRQWRRRGKTRGLQPSYRRLQFEDVQLAMINELSDDIGENGHHEEPIEQINDDDVDDVWTSATSDKETLLNTEK